MKKIALIVCLTSIYLLRAQAPEIKKANDFLFEYNAKKSTADLEKAVENVRKAMAVESNNNDAIANYISGLVLKTNYDATGQKNTELVSESYNYLKKAVEIGKLEEKDKGQALKFIKYLGYDFYNIGINEYNAKSYDKAINSYKKLKELYAFLAKNNQTLAVDGANELKMSDIDQNYLVFTRDGGNKSEAVAVLKSQLQSNPTENNYLSIVQMLADNPSEQSKYIAEGLGKFPNNKDLLIHDVNKSMSEKNFSNAKPKLQKLIELDPKNHQFFLLLGNIYESEKDLENAKKSYQKGLEIKQDEFELNYNLAVLQFNEAVAVYNKNTENEKGPELYLPLFKTAKTSFEKCKQLQPNNSNIDQLIKKIDEIK